MCLMLLLYRTPEDGGHSRNVSDSLSCEYFSTPSLCAFCFWWAEYVSDNPQHKPAEHRYDVERCTAILKRSVCDMYSLPLYHMCIISVKLCAARGKAEGVCRNKLLRPVLYFILQKSPYSRLSYAETGVDHAPRSARSP